MLIFLHLSPINHFRYWVFLYSSPICYNSTSKAYGTCSIWEAQRINDTVMFLLPWLISQKTFYYCSIYFWDFSLFFSFYMWMCVKTVNCILYTKLRASHNSPYKQIKIKCEEDITESKETGMDIFTKQGSLRNGLGT